MTRDDVAANSGDKRWANSGFRLVVNWVGLPSGQHSISVSVHSQRLGWFSRQITINYENTFHSPGPAILADSDGETTLYDTKGNPVAHIAADDGNTIYLWTGEPVAYLQKDNIYGFNGKHLGWFQEGILWDHSGERVGYVRETLPWMAMMETVKYVRYVKYVKTVPEVPPMQPLKLLNESDIPLRNFLFAGYPR